MSLRYCFDRFPRILFGLVYKLSEEQVDGQIFQLEDGELPFADLYIKRGLAEID